MDSPGNSDKAPRAVAQALVGRERVALDVHRASIRGGHLPPPSAAPRGTFVHGLLLPLSLLAVTLRSPDLRRPFLRLFAVRMALLVVLGAIAASQAGSDDETKTPGVHVVASSQPSDDDDDDDDGEDGDEAQKPVDVDVPGFHMHFGDAGGEMQILGKDVPVETTSRRHGKALRVADAPPAPEPTTRFGRLRAAVARGWARIVAIVATISIVEGVIVFFSRRYDDWLSFYISGLAGIRPESAEPPVRRLALDLKWLLKKLRRKIRGYLLFGSGLPLLYLLQVVPRVGSYLFAIAVTLWAWYWGGVFTAAKSAHAWADEGTAGPPRMVASWNARFARGFWAWPMRVYGRIWARVVRGINPAAATFERSPAPYLGLAVARAVFGLPGLYVLMRPIVSVAAGRICAEADPGKRFSVE